MVRGSRTDWVFEKTAAHPRASASIRCTAAHIMANISSPSVFSRLLHLPSSQ